MPDRGTTFIQIAGGNAGDALGGPCRLLPDCAIDRRAQTIPKLKVLTIPVNGIYFDQIASGEKLEEYRLVNPYWGKRLRERSYDHVVLTRGYPKGGGIEGVTRLTRQWRGAMVRTITHPHFGDEPELVFAIDVSEPVIVRSCTCHPIDRPLGDCPRKYAVAECRRAAQTIEAAPLATFIPHHIAFDDWIETILERLHDLGGQHAERGAAALSDRPFHSQPNNVEAQA